MSPLLFEALDVAYSVAERTHGAVDPTVGNAIATLGYDCDLAQVCDRPPVPPEALGPVAGFRHVQLDRRQRTVRIPRGVRLDLGSSAKALVADRAAARIAGALGSGVLVNIGGDVAVAGLAPPAGWPVGISVESSTPVDEVDQVVSVHRGGLASSSTVRADVDRRPTDRAPHHRSPHRGLRRPLLEPGVGDRGQLRGRQCAHDRLADLGRTGPPPSRPSSARRYAWCATMGTRSSSAVGPREHRR